MNDLAQWLRTQLDDDAVRAKAAPPGPWAMNDAGGILDANGVRVIPSVGGALDGRVSRWPEGPVVDHLLVHNPARVLREIDTKRQILALHRPVQRRSTGSGGGTIEDCQMCGHFPAQYPCRTLRLLALPYTDRPDYREEWRP